MRFEIKKRFFIITPTVGRDSIKSCIKSVTSQTFTNYIHLVVGDGPLPSWVREYCEGAGSRYMELPEKKGVWGAHARNLALETLENGQDATYVVFLDDDNILFPWALENLNKASQGDPKLIYQPIVHYRRWDNVWWSLPTEMPPKKCFWDTLNGCYRADVIAGLRWNFEYEHDFHFAQEAIAKAGTNLFVKASDSPGGLHL